MFPWINFRLVRVPFFLEEGYNEKPSTFRETHEQRMVRKFGSLEAFNAVKKAHGLISRGAEVGLDASCGFTQERLDQRVQSATMNSHRLVHYVTQNFGIEKAELLYDELNRRHFLEAGALNDNQLLEDSLSVAIHSDHDTDNGDERAKTERYVREARDYLASSRGTEEVLDLVAQTSSLGIHSIPTLAIDGGQIILNGAVSSTEIVQHLTALLEANHGQPKGARLFQQATCGA